MEVLRFTEGKEAQRSDKVIDMKENFNRCTDIKKKGWKFDTGQVQTGGMKRTLLALALVFSFLRFLGCSPFATRYDQLIKRQEAQQTRITMLEGGLDVATAAAAADDPEAVAELQRISDELESRRTEVATLDKKIEQLQPIVNKESETNKQTMMQIVGGLFGLVNLAANGIKKGVAI